MARAFHISGAVFQTFRLFFLHEIKYIRVFESLLFAYDFENMRRREFLGPSGVHVYGPIRAQM